MFSGDRVAVLHNTFLDGGDGCLRLQMNLEPLLCSLEMLSMANFSFCVFFFLYHN